MEDAKAIGAVDRVLEQHAFADSCFTAKNERATPPLPSRFEHLVDARALHLATNQHLRDRLTASARRTGIFPGAIASDQVTARRVYDENGNLVRRVLSDDYTFGQFSDALTDATVPYSQSDTRTDVLAVPGDLGSATETTTALGAA